MANYIQIPPDSTGKRIRHIERLEIRVQNIDSELINVSRGSTVTGNSSGVTATYISFHIDFDNNIIEVQDPLGQFLPGETLTIETIPNAAEVISTQDLYTPSVNIVDPDNPFNKLSINRFGSMKTSYIDGDPTFDTFGALKAAQPVIRDTHTFIYGDDLTKYGDLVTSGGTIEVLNQSSELLLTCDTTATSSASRITHRYYPYTPGIGTEIKFSIRCGDEGKENVVRRWGMFDNNNGVFFELNGDAFCVGQRSSASGSVVDEVIPQDDFNGEKLINSDLDDFKLNLSKYNLYWIDFAWLGVVRIKFGVYGPSGRKITLHTIKNANSSLSPWATRGSLPLKLEQYNTGISASSSEMKMICAVIAGQLNDEYQGKKYTLIASNNNITESAIPIKTIRPVTTIVGKDNRKTYFGLDFEYSIKSADIIIELYVNASLTGESFVGPFNGSSVEEDDSATAYTGGLLLERLILPAGGGKREVRSEFNNSLSLFADGTAPTLTFVAKTLHTGDVADASILFRWREVN